MIEGDNVKGGSKKRVPHFSAKLTHGVLDVLIVALPFTAILILGLPSWFPFTMVLDTVTLIRPDAPWSDPAWSPAGRLLWSLLLALGVVSLMNVRSRWARWLPESLLLAGLAIAQASLWTTGQSKYCLIGGLVPTSDAAGYLDYASHMLQNHRIVAGFSDRPMFAAMLSSLMQLSNSNLQVVLGVLLLVCGIGMALATREMHRYFGTAGAVVFLFVIYTFYNRSIGMLMTEHLGLALGLFALGLLLRGLLEPRKDAWLAGLFLLSAALCARAGAFFVLPALCLLTGRRFRKTGRFSMPWCAISIAVALVPFGLNRLLIVRLFDSKTLPQSNFTFVAYGILRGTNWTDAQNTFGQDHARIRQATWELLKKKPQLVLHAMRRTWRTFFWDSYGFIFMGAEWSALLLYSLIFAFALGVARAGKSAYDGFTVASSLGILASIPCVPPVDCDMMRAYAATMPLQACLAAGGIAALLRLVAPAFRKGNSESARLIEIPVASARDLQTYGAFSGVTLALVFVLPLGRSLLLPEKTDYVEIGSRPPNQYPPTFSINLVPDDGPRTRVPNVRIGDFRARLGGLDARIWHEQAVWLARLPAGISIVNGGGLGQMLISTDKLRQGDKPAEYKTYYIGFFTLSIERDLALPGVEELTPVPTSGKTPE